jgi:hypothetical protein
MAKRIQQTKKQHYVPQFYLRRFTHDGSHLYVYDKFAGRSFPSRVEDVASENCFYDETAASPQSSLGSGPQEVEQRLAALETKTSAALKALIEGVEKDALIDPATKRDVALLMAAQVFRTRETRTAALQLQQKAREALRGEQLASELEAWLADSERPEVAAEVQRMLLLNASMLDHVADVLLSHIWVAFVNDTAEPLWASDHPVVPTAQIRDPLRGTSGLGSPGIEVSFPLSSKLSLVMYERTVFGMLSPLDGMVRTLLPENVTYHNSGQVAQSYRQLYSPSGAFGLAELMRREHPDLFKADRRRIEVG